MIERLWNFFAGTPVEAAQGGERVPRERPRLAALLAGISLLSCLAMPPAFAKARSRESDKNTRQEFTRRYEAIGPGHPFILVDNDIASSSPSQLFRAVRNRFNDLLPVESQASITLRLIETAREPDGPFANSLEFKSRTPDEMEMISYAADVPDVMDFESWLYYVGEIIGRSVRKEAMIDDDAMFRQALYHEIFGHCTEHTCPEIGRLEAGDNEDYSDSMCELRADIATLVGMARDTGSPHTGEAIAHMRAATVFNYDSSKIYDNALALDAVNARLANLVSLPSFRRMDDAATVGMINALFMSVRPDENAHAQNRIAFDTAVLMGSNNPKERAEARRLMAEDPEMGCKALLILRRARRAEDFLFMPTEKEGAPVPAASRTAVLSLPALHP